MSGSAGWHTDPSDPRVQRYWDGSGWTAQRFWTGAQWVDVALGTTPPVVPQFQVVPNRRRYLGLWIGAGVVLGVVGVVIAAAIASGGGGGGHAANTQASFCSDFNTATDKYQADLDHIFDLSSSPAARARYQQEASTAASLATRAPSEPKSQLLAVAKQYNIMAAGRDPIGNFPEGPVMQLGEWQLEYCE